MVDCRLRPLAERFEQVAKGSDLWKAWRALHAERGWPWLGEDRECPDWVWLPGVPDGLADGLSGLEAVRAAMAAFEAEFDQLNIQEAAE